MCIKFFLNAEALALRLSLGEKNYWGRKPTAREKADEVKRLHAEGRGATAIADQLGIARRSVYNILSDKPEDAEVYKDRAKSWNARKGVAA